KRLGYRASLRLVSLDAYNRLRGDPNSHAQVAPSTWTADYAAPSNFIDVTLSCRSLTSGFNNAHFCEPRIDREIDRALALQQTDAAKANALWSHIDRQLTDEAPWVPLFNQQALDFVSSRVGNYQINVQMGGLRDQMWVR